MFIIYVAVNACSVSVCESIIYFFRVQSLPRLYAIRAVVYPALSKSGLFPRFVQCLAIQMAKKFIHF